MTEQNEQENWVNEVDTYKLVNKKPLKKAHRRAKSGSTRKLMKSRTNKVFLQNERILEQLRWIVFGWSESRS